MDDELDIPEVIDTMLPHGVIDISYEVGARVPLREIERRTAHYFDHADLGYKQITEDTFKLKVRSPKYPVFGSFAGTVHIYEDVQERVFRFEGYLQYRVSVLWFVGVLAFFFLLVYMIHPPFWQGVFFEAVASGLCLFWTYKLGQSDRDAVAEHVEGSFLRLRSSIQNMR